MSSLAQPTWELLKKHQASSLIASIVDFGVMIALVQLLRASPTWATVFGAGIGASTNFMLGRHWTFRATSDRPYSQAIRYAVVAVTSLALNAFGEHLLAERLHVQYVVARLGVALAVSVLWNFPLHRAFVFAEKRIGDRR